MLLEFGILCQMLNITEAQVNGNNLVQKYTYLKKVTNDCGGIITSFRKTSFMIVGDAEVGKSKFVENMVTNHSRFKINKFASTSLKKIQKEDRKLDPHDGLNIVQWYPRDSNFKVLLFDFSNTEDYYNAHLHFMKDETVFIYVFDANSPPNKQRIAHWISTIITVSPSPTLYIVGTHCDLPNATLYRDDHIREINSIIHHITFVYSKKLKIISPSDHFFIPNSNNNNNNNNNDDDNDNNNKVVINDSKLIQNQQSYWGVCTVKHQKMADIMEKLKLSLVNTALEHMRIDTFRCSWLYCKQFLINCSIYAEYGITAFVNSITASLCEKYLPHFRKDGIGLVDMKIVKEIAQSLDIYPGSGFDQMCRFITSEKEILRIQECESDYLILKPMKLLNVFQMIFSSTSPVTSSPLPEQPAITLSSMFSKLKISRSKGLSSPIVDHVARDQKSSYIITQSDLVNKFNNYFREYKPDSVSQLTNSVTTALSWGVRV